MTVNAQAWKKKLDAMAAEVSRLETLVRKEKARVIARGGQVPNHCD